MNIKKFMLGVTVAACSFGMLGVAPSFAADINLPNGYSIGVAKKWILERDKIITSTNKMDRVQALKKANVTLKGRLAMYKSVLEDEIVKAQNAIKGANGTHEQFSNTIRDAQAKIDKIKAELEVSRKAQGSVADYLFKDKLDEIAKLENVIVANKKGNKVAASYVQDNVVRLDALNAELSVVKNEIRKIGLNSYHPCGLRASECDGFFKDHYAKELAMKAPESKKVTKGKNTPEAMKAPKGKNTPEAMKAPKGKNTPESKKVTKGQNTPEAMKAPESKKAVAKVASLAQTGTNSGILALVASAIAVVGALLRRKFV